MKKKDLKAATECEETTTLTLCQKRSSTVLLRYPLQVDIQVSMKTSRLWSRFPIISDSAICGHRVKYYMSECKAVCSKPKRFCENSIALESFIH